VRAVWESDGMTVPLLVLLMVVCWVVSVTGGGSDTTVGAKNDESVTMQCWLERCGCSSS